MPESFQVAHHHENPMINYNVIVDYVLHWEFTNTFKIVSKIDSHILVKALYVIYYLNTIQINTYSIGVLPEYLIQWYYCTVLLRETWYKKDSGLFDEGRKVN